MTTANDNATPSKAISIADLAKALNISEDEVLKNLAKIFSAREDKMDDQDMRNQE